MKLNKQGWILLLAASSLWSQASSQALPPATGAGNDSNSLQISKLQIQEADIWRPDSVRLFNPIISGTASLILPGAGQVYTRHYVKAVFFIGLEAILGSMANFWRITAQSRDADERKFIALAAADTDLVVKASDREESFLSHHDALESRYSAYNFLTWTAGGYIFNILDALGSSNFFNNSKEKKPGTAALLAAIPGLGLGQWYNGALSKAGMVMMGQISMGLMAYNSQRLMKQAEDNYLRLNARNADSVPTPVVQAYSGKWSSTRYRAFTNRNMYLWYSVFFYGYSVFDAVVDAYLHEYPKKMRIKPDLVLGNNRIYCTLQTTF
jgi:hypothetical protein